MTQFILLLAGIIIGGVLVYILPFRSQKILVAWTIFLVLVAVCVAWYITFKQSPDYQTSYPDPLYMPNYFETSELSLGEKLRYSIEETLKTYVYGFVGLGMSFFFRGRESLNRREKKKGPWQQGPPKKQKRK